VAAGCKTASALRRKALINDQSIEKDTCGPCRDAMGNDVLACSLIAGTNHATPQALFYFCRRWMMPTGAGQKREREFKKLEHQFKQSHRYPGREEEVAARIVNKQRSQYGETKAEKEKDRRGASPDRNLPIEGYQKMTIPQVLARIDGLSGAEIKKIRTYETKHKNRKGLIARLDRRLAN